MSTPTASPSTSSKQRQSRSIKSTLIDPFAQVKLGVYVIIITMIFMGLAGWLFYQAQDDQYQHVVSIFEVAPEDKRELLNNDIFEANITKIALLFTLYILILCTVLFRLTHQYYGPLISIKRFAESINEGKYYSRISVRKRDELKDLALTLNKMAVTLEEKHGSLVGKDGQSIRRRQADQSKNTAATEVHQSSTTPTTPTT